MLLKITPSLKETMDELFKEVGVLDCKTLRTRISDDETPWPEYGDVQEYRMCNDGMYPGELGDGYYYHGGAVYHDDVHIEECAAEAICEFYNKENGISKSFEELVAYLDKCNMLLKYFKNVYPIMKMVETPFKYVDKSKLDKTIRLNRPRAFRINERELYLIQPDRRKHEFITLPEKVLIDTKMYVDV